MANSELKIIEANFNNTSLEYSKITDDILSYKRYVNAIKQGAKIFSIKHPSMPTRTSLGLKFFLASSVILGLMTGVIYLIIFNAIRKFRG